MEFSISKDGIEFDSGEKKEQNIGVIKEYAISNDLDIITINDREINKDNEEQYKKIYDTDKNKLIITKEKVYIYENKILSKSLDIKEELNGENFLDVVIYFCFSIYSSIFNTIVYSNYFIIICKSNRIYSNCSIKYI